MIIDSVKYVLIYLTDWQMRMVKDVPGVDCHTLQVPISGGVVPLYLVLPGTLAKRMYFTDWQREEIKAESGEDCAFIELAPTPIHIMYGVFSFEPVTLPSGQIEYKTKS